MSELIEWDPQIEVINGESSRSCLEIAYSCAWKYSDDPVTKTGAVIAPIGANHVISGANHFPIGLNPSEEQKNNREWKLKHIIHAEPAVIYSAARNGYITGGAWMYMPWVPCTDCAKAIIDSGLAALVGHKQMIMKTPERWRESTEYALELLRKCGVGLFMYDGKIGNVQSLFNGEVWEP